MKDNVNVKNRKWEFNAEVANCFDDMLSRSIPDYFNMRDLTLSVGLNFVKPAAYITDLGCSSGGSIQPFIDLFGARNRYNLYDVSEPMLDVCRDKFKGYIQAGLMDVRHLDIRNGIPSTPNTLVISCLTLQFTPIEYRYKIVQSIYDSLSSGGALLLIEKVLGNSASLDDLMVTEYYNIKRDNAYTDEQIRDKRRSLEGVLVPITAKWNEDLLRDCGFSQVDCYWRYLNFAAWVAVKR